MYVRTCSQYQLVILQGQVEMYETISDLAARNIDTRQLLGLIRDNDSKEKADDKYAYENGSDNSDEVEDGKFLFLYCNT